MSEELSIHRIHYDENPILLNKIYTEGVSYAEALEEAYRAVMLAWDARVREGVKNDQGWAEFHETRDRAHREITKLRRQALDRGRSQRHILRRAYLYQISDLMSLEDEMEIREIEAQIRAIGTASRRKRTRVKNAETYTDRQKFREVLDDYKEIIIQYCKERILRFDLDFTLDLPMQFRWKWDLGTISVFYGGDSRDIYENGHGHAEFSTTNLRTIYLRPAFWEHEDWVIQRGRFKNGELVEEEWSEKSLRLETVMAGRALVGA